MPGTTTPLPEPSEHESDAAFPVAVDDADVRRAADVLSPTRRLLRLHRPGDGERRRLRVAERLEADREQAAAAGGRRVRPELVTAVRRHERFRSITR